MALHTPPRWLLCLGMALHFILLANPVAAEVPAESAIVGMYTQRDVDSQAQLFILDDKTFCFTFTGGALDLVKAGRWELGADGVLHLNETRVEQALYPVVVRKGDRLLALSPQAGRGDTKGVGGGQAHLRRYVKNRLNMSFSFRNLQ
jgi:hypothetical protein